MTKLRQAIETAHLQWTSGYGNCTMCCIPGDIPDLNGNHIHKGLAYKCGNERSCTLCHGCLPPDEICQACGRKNVRDTVT